MPHPNLSLYAGQFRALNTQTGTQPCSAGPPGWQEHPHVPDHHLLGLQVPGEKKVLPSFISMQHLLELHSLSQQRFLI